MWVDTAAFSVALLFWDLYSSAVPTSRGALRVYCCLFMSSTSPSPPSPVRPGRWAEIWPPVSSRLLAFLHRQNSPAAIFTLFLLVFLFFLSKTHARQSFSSRPWVAPRGETRTRAFREVKQEQLKRDIESELLGALRAPACFRPQSCVVSDVMMNGNTLSVDEKDG